MSPAAFKHSLNRKTPPAGLSAALQALWWAASDDWGKAHRIVMNGHDQDCAWVHAYQALAAEWDEIVAALLQSGPR